MYVSFFYFLSWPCGKHCGMGHRTHTACFASKVRFFLKTSCRSDKLNTKRHRLYIVQSASLFSFPFCMPACSVNFTSDNTCSTVRFRDRRGTYFKGYSILPIIYYACKDRIFCVDFQVLSLHSLQWSKTANKLNHILQSFTSTSFLIQIGKDKDSTWLISRVCSELAQSSRREHSLIIPLGWC